MEFKYGLVLFSLLLVGFKVDFLKCKVDVLREGALKGRVRTPCLQLQRHSSERRANFPGACTNSIISMLYPRSIIQRTASEYLL
jgi:hypothetical protein